MKRKIIFALNLYCALFMAVMLTSCGDNGKDEPIERNEDYYFGSWLSEDGTEYYFYEDGHGTFRSGDVGGTFNYTVNVTLIHLHITYWSDIYHTVWKNDIDASYYSDKDMLNINGIYFYREGKVPKKDDTPTEPVDTLATGDTVVGK